METLAKDAPLDSLGLSSGDHWVRFHVEGDSISFEVEASVPQRVHAMGSHKPTGFVQKWGGSVRKEEDSRDEWLSRINKKHLR